MQPSQADQRQLDLERYGALLAETRPCVIETPEDHDRLLTAAETLMDKGDQLSLEERKVLELLALLIEVFEAEVEAEDDDASDEPEPEETPGPHQILQRLLDARGWEPTTLNDIFGNPALTSEVLAGRRAISKGQAKALGKLFQTPPKLFHE